ncbi:aKG-HExxH-type peptide beta-hydroxylase [Paraburkholderia tropica]|uniref:aKG-HExxH-type peptide beta-hydroxylase n=1 Tax=Paraburkholderia tropica TaxID=92647 RepID=UPI002AB0D507|nr:HEXXH motif-containing putative peptide modification protein [Paraburkholderia tropica]
MTYSFMPDINVSKELSEKVRIRLKDAYVDMLGQLSDYKPDIFSDAVTEYFYALDAEKFGGLHCFLYHYSISLAGDSHFDEIARLMRQFSDGRYDSLPRYLSAAAVDGRLLREILDQIKLGTTHDQIRLEPLDTALEAELVAIAEHGVARLVRAAPELATENALMVKSILFFDSVGDTSERALSFTGDKLQSMVLINGTHENNWIFVLDKIVHEAAHTYLYGINLDEEMVLNTREFKYASPLRRDERDMLGIYHATFVIQRLILAFTRILDVGGLLSEEEDVIQALLRYYFSRVDDGYRTALEHGILSPLARKLIDEGNEEVSRASALLGITILTEH